jgi:hypothetical protein
MEKPRDPSSELGRPTTVRVGLSLVLMNALIWLLFGMIMAAGPHPAMPSTPAVHWGMAGPGWGCAASLVVLALWLAGRKRIGYWGTRAALLVLALATVTDELGPVDLVARAIILPPLISLVKDQAWYLRCR